MSNASPLILLAKVGEIDLLRALFPDFVIPAGVAKEITAGPADDPARIWLSSQGTARVVGLQSVDPLVAAWDLGLGESEVLSWARARPGWEAVVDDAAARKCASALGIAVLGTLGVVLLAKRRGILPEVQTVLGRLREQGFRIAPDLLRGALRGAGEA